MIFINKKLRIYNINCILSLLFIKMLKNVILLYIFKLKNNLVNVHKFYFYINN